MYFKLDLIANDKKGRLNFVIKYRSDGTKTNRTPYCTRTKSNRICITQMLGISTDMTSGNSCIQSLVHDKTVSNSSVRAKLAFIAKSFVVFFSSK